MPLPTVFQTCQPRDEVITGELPDAIFAADLWEVVNGKAHPEYQDAQLFFANSHPTESLSFLLKDVAGRLVGQQGCIPVFRLETGFGGGKTHNLIAAVHLARQGASIANALASYGIENLPAPEATRVAAFVGEQSDPLSGVVHGEGSEAIRTYTPWGEIALQIGGREGYESVRANDEAGGAPSRQAIEQLFADRPVLVLIDELVLYLARCLALPAGHPRHAVASQMPTFLQTLARVANGGPRSLIFTLPTEQDANRLVTADLKQHLPQLLESVGELEKTKSRDAQDLTPTQPHERAAVIARRLFRSVDRTVADEVARLYVAYYEQQRAAGVEIERQAFERAYLEQIAASYPLHPTLISLFAEQLASIPDFQATRGALRLVARTIKSAWANRASYPDAFLLHPFHIDLTRPEVRDEVLARLGRGAYVPCLDADVVKAGGTTHASQAEQGWPLHAATEAATVVFLHSLPDGARGLSSPEVCLAVGRPGYDLAYVKRGLTDTESHAWHMRLESERYLFRTRASVNKRYQERLSRVGAGEVREQLDGWIQELYSGFDAFQVIPFPEDHTAIPDSPDRLRLVIVHYDKEGGNVGGGDRLSFTRNLFTKTGVNESPRVYRNNIVFLLAEATRIQPLKDTMRSLIAWERVRKDLEDEQTRLAEANGLDYRTVKEQARRGVTGVPAEFMALESDLGTVLEKLGGQELGVRTSLLEAYRVLAFPLGAEAEQYDLWNAPADGRPMLECFRVDFGETPQQRAGRRAARTREAVAQEPILQCLRREGKLVQEPTLDNNVVLAPQLLRRRPLWQQEERRVSTLEIWERLRRNPELPMVIKQVDLLPTLRAGVTTQPDALWVYYDQAEKRVYTRESAAELAPVLSGVHYLYDLRPAAEDRVLPVTAVTTTEVWEYLWPRQAGDRTPSTNAEVLLNAARSSVHFPVLPSASVLWAGLREGARENRWVLYLRGSNLAIGAQELMEWPATPRFDEHTELWQYQAALDARLYPRAEREARQMEPITYERLKERCWPTVDDRLATEDIERVARSVWADLSRPRLERVIREGVSAGLWGVWRQGADEAYYAPGDPLPTAGLVGPSSVLVVPSSQLARQIECLRPGRGPQPVQQVGTPQEALTRLWEGLETYANVLVSELTLTVMDRDSFENTLAATWADRPSQAQPHASLTCTGQRIVEGKPESAHLEFEGRFEEVRTMLAPIWPFRAQGQLDLGLTVKLRFDPPVSLSDGGLITYRTALMQANQGTLEAMLVPARRTTGEVG